MFWTKVAKFPILWNCPDVISLHINAAGRKGKELVYLCVCKVSVKNRSRLSPSQPPAVRDSFKYTKNASFVLSMRNTGPQKQLLMLWVKNGRVMWSKSKVGICEERHICKRKPHGSW